MIYPCHGYKLPMTLLQLSQQHRTERHFTRLSCKITGARHYHLHARWPPRWLTPTHQAQSCSGYKFEGSGTLAMIFVDHLMVMFMMGHRLQWRLRDTKGVWFQKRRGWAGPRLSCRSHHRLIASKGFFWCMFQWVLLAAIHKDEHVVNHWLVDYSFSYGLKPPTRQGGKHPMNISQCEASMNSWRLLILFIVNC